MGLIWIIIVIIIIVNATKKQNENHARDNRNAPAQQARPSAPNQQIRPNAPQQQTWPYTSRQQTQPYASSQQTRSNAPQQQAWTGAANQPTRPSLPSQRRWQQSSASGSTKQTAYGSNAKPVKNDILSRATANVMENTVDISVQQKVENADFTVGLMDVEAPSELMREVNDLMITGYQADISFERDFLAEGLELLDRYNIPETLPQ